MKDLGFKDMWNVELGVTYVPWDKLPTDLSLLVDGGMIDEDTIPDHLKGEIENFDFTIRQLLLSAAVTYELCPHFRPLDYKMSHTEAKL